MVDIPNTNANVSILLRNTFIHVMGAIVVLVVWYLDFQQPVQSVPINTGVVISIPADGEVYSIQHYVIKYVIDLRQVGDLFRYSTFLLQ
jgi:hypothetical protein